MHVLLTLSRKVRSLGAQKCWLAIAIRSQEQQKAAENYFVFLVS